MDETREVFSKTNFDEKTLYYLNNAIEEFDDLFGEYFSRQKVIDQIKRNLKKSIEWKSISEMKNALGEYNNKEKSIGILADLEEDKIKYVFFHELLHCILKYNKYSGLVKEYEIEGLEDKKIYRGMGLTEGITQYLTAIRDAKYSKEPLNSYPILTQQTGNLVDLIGKKKFLSMVFTSPEVLEEFLENSDVDVDFFLDSFDTIWRNEKDIFISSLYGKEIKQKSSLASALGIGETKDYIRNKKDIVRAAKDIINTLSSLLMNRNIKTVENFEEVFNTIAKYSEQLNLRNNYSNYEDLLGMIDEIAENLQISREEFLERLPEGSDVRKTVYGKFYFDKFQNLTPKRKLQEIIQINKSDSEIGMVVYDNPFSENFKTMITEEIFENHLINLDREFYRLIEGFSEIILEKGYDTRTLAMNNISFGRESDDIKDIFELYVTLQDKKIYVGTFIHDMEDNGETSEFLRLTGKGKEEALVNYPDINRDSEVFRDSKGNIFVHNRNGTYTLIDEHGEKYQSQETEYQMSTVESMQKEILKKKANLQKIELIGGYPKFMLQLYKKRIEDLKRRRNEILQGTKEVTEQMRPERMEPNTSNKHDTYEDFDYEL